MKRSAAILILLSACGGPPAPKPDNLIECAVDGVSDFARVCSVERTEGGSGVIFTIRSPSGSFRRLATTADGRGLMAADGAEPATVTIVGQDRIEVSIGPDRYRFPARAR
jgi:hypothetical protein